MYENIRDARIGLLNRRLDRVGDLMSITHRDVAVHSDMKVDIKIEAHLPGQTPGVAPAARATDEIIS